MPPIAILGKRRLWTMGFWLNLQKDAGKYCTKSTGEYFVHLYKEWNGHTSNTNGWRVTGRTRYSTTLIVKNLCTQIQATESHECWKKTATCFLQHYGGASGGWKWLSTFWIEYFHGWGPKRNANSPFTRAYNHPVMCFARRNQWLKCHSRKGTINKINSSICSCYLLCLLGRTAWHIKIEQHVRATLNVCTPAAP